jgi:hypothetical protein
MRAQTIIATYLIINGTRAIASNARAIVPQGKLPSLAAARRNQMVFRMHRKRSPSSGVITPDALTFIATSG